MTMYPYNTIATHYHVNYEHSNASIEHYPLPTRLHWTGRRELGLFQQSAAITEGDHRKEGEV